MKTDHLHTERVKTVILDFGPGHAVALVVTAVLCTLAFVGAR